MIQMLHVEIQGDYKSRYLSKSIVLFACMSVCSNYKYRISNKVLMRALQIFV